MPKQKSSKSSKINQIVTKYSKSLSLSANGEIKCRYYFITIKFTHKNGKQTVEDDLKGKR